MALATNPIAASLPASQGKGVRHQPCGSATKKSPPSKEPIIHGNGQSARKWPQPATQSSPDQRRGLRVRALGPNDARTLSGIGELRCAVAGRRC